MLTGTIIMLIVILVVVYGGSGYLMALNMKKGEKKDKDEKK